jgi:hypothetical protein
MSARHEQRSTIITTNLTSTKPPRKRCDLVAVRSRRKRSAVNISDLYTAVTLAISDTTTV